MDKIYPLTIIADRYNGSYSGGVYTAFPLDSWDVPAGSSGSDIECWEFWDSYPGPVGKGKTPNEALNNLEEIMNK